MTYVPNITFTLVDRGTPPNAEAIARTNVYHEGTEAAYDTLEGLIPCVVTAIKEVAYGFQCGPYDAIEFRITEDRGAYRKGEVLKADARSVVPCRRLIRKQYGCSINSLYCYAPKGDKP